MKTVWILLFSFGIVLYAHAVPKKPYSIQDKVDDLQMEVSNHTTELRIFDEKLNNSLTILESMRDQVQDAAKAQKDAVRGQSVGLENRILSLESSLKTITADIKQIQTHQNESANALKQYKQKIGELSDNTEALQGALKTLMEAMQVNLAASTKIYSVMSGDTLEKIARKNKTSVKELIALNSLKGEKIVIGQILKLP